MTLCFGVEERNYRLSLYIVPDEIKVHAGDKLSAVKYGVDEFIHLIRTSDSFWFDGMLSDLERWFGITEFPKCVGYWVSEEIPWELPTGRTGDAEIHHTI